MQEGSPGFHP
jgi:hypothetical protein